MNSTNILPVKNFKKYAKVMSYILRHGAKDMGVPMDEEGYVLASDLCKYLKISRQMLDEIVATNDKQRFAFSSNGRKIRASQGHSLTLKITYEQAVPPEYLYHGTTTKSLDGIMREGILPGKRSYVHLSLDVETATKVGSRHGKPIILKIHAKAMHDYGHIFYLSENNVWLADLIPPPFFEIYYVDI